MAKIADALTIERCLEEVLGSILANLAIEIGYTCDTECFNKAFERMISLIAFKMFEMGGGKNDLP